MKWVLFYDQLVNAALNKSRPSNIEFNFLVFISQYNKIISNTIPEEILANEVKLKKLSKKEGILKNDGKVDKLVSKYNLSVWEARRSIIEEAGNYKSANANIQEKRKKTWDQHQEMILIRNDEKSQE